MSDLKFAVVTGGASGLGAEIITALQGYGIDSLSFDSANNPLMDVRFPNAWDDCPDGVDLLINCAGVNRIDWLANFTEADWDEVLDVNAKGIYKMSRWAFQSLRENKGTILNIVSNASHMPMTCSLAYNASKAAAHMMTLQLARELTKTYGITVFGVSPNKLAGTGMSRDIEQQVVATRGWTAEYAEQYQRNALLTGEETPPRLVAEFIAYLLSSKDRHKFLTGCVIPYGA